MKLLTPDLRQNPARSSHGKPLSNRSKQEDHIRVACCLCTIKQKEYQWMSKLLCTGKKIKRWIVFFLLEKNLASFVSYQSLLQYRLKLREGINYRLQYRMFPPNYQRSAGARGDKWRLSNRSEPPTNACPQGSIRSPGIPYTPLSTGQAGDASLTEPRSVSELNVLNSIAWRFIKTI